MPEFSGKNHFKKEPSDALRCELIRSATAIFLDPDGWKEAGPGSLQYVARDFLFREFRRSEPDPELGGPV